MSRRPRSLRRRRKEGTPRRMPRSMACDRGRSYPELMRHCGWKSQTPRAPTENLACDSLRFRPARGLRPRGRVRRAPGTPPWPLRARSRPVAKSRRCHDGSVSGRRSSVPIAVRLRPRRRRTHPCPRRDAARWCAASRPRPISERRSTCEEQSNLSTCSDAVRDVHGHRCLCHGRGPR